MTLGLLEPATLNGPRRARTNGGRHGSGVTGLVRSIVRSLTGSGRRTRSGRASTSTKAAGMRTTRHTAAASRWTRDSNPPTAPSSAAVTGGRPTGRCGRSSSLRNALTALAATTPGRTQRGRAGCSDRWELGQ